MHPSSPLHETSAFTHQCWDKIANIAAFCESDSVAVDGVSGVSLGTVALAPARSASITGDQITILLHLRPTRATGRVDYLSKGKTQYGIYSPDESTLAFVLETDAPNLLTTPIPEHWYEQWHTVAATYTGEMMTLVVDGEVMASQPAAGLIRYGVGGLLLGRHVARDSSGGGMVAALQLFDVAQVPHTLASISDTPGPDCRIDLRFKDMAPFEAPATTEPALSDTLPLPFQSILDGWKPDEAALQSGHLHLPTGLDVIPLPIHAHWKLSADGISVQSGTVNVDKEDTQLHVPYNVPAPAPGTEWWLNLEFINEAKEILGKRQFLLALGQPPMPGPSAAALAPLEISEKDNSAFFEGTNFTLKIDLPTATITSWTVDDEELLELGPLHQLWRAPLWEETFPQDPVAAEWSRAGLADNMMGVVSMEALQDIPSRVVLRFKGLIIRRNSEVLFEVERDYAIHGNGEVILTQRLFPMVPMPPLGRVGMELRVPKDMNRITWFGQGPTALFTSSAAGDLVDRYETQASDDFPMQGWPVERGHKRDVRWITARNSAGRGLFIGCHTPFSATVSPYSTFQLTEAHTAATLTPDSAYTLHLDDQLCYDTAAEAGSTACIETEFRMRGLLPDDTMPWAYLKTCPPRDLENADSI